MTHLLRGRYSSVFAPTGTCANPVGSPLLRFFTSFEESLQVATSPCCHRDLLDVILRVFPCLPGPLPRRSHRVHAPVTFPDVIGLPLGRLGRLPAFVHDATSRGDDFEAADIPLCSGQQVWSPPRLHPPLRLCRRAAEAFTSGQNVLRYLRTH